jgi:glutathione-regulated potassium-efflux system ancillary protein KefG
MDPETGDYIGSQEVAEILGLAHRNSVSTYRRRYPDFPSAVPSPHGGRTLLWRRDEIVAWRRAWSDPGRRDRDGSPARLEVLVDAAVRLLLENPGLELGVRQIAAAAGMAHSDIYRYADSKEQILALAVARIVDDYRLSMPATLDDVVRDMEQFAARSLQRRAAMLVVLAELLRDPDTDVGPPTPARFLADLVRADRAETGRVSAVSPEVAAASVAALFWGWAVLGRRYCKVMDVDEVPVEELAAVARAILAA